MAEKCILAKNIVEYYFGRKLYCIVLLKKLAISAEKPVIYGHSYLNTAAANFTTGSVDS